MNIIYLLLVSPTPKAAINWILLDENFKYVTGSFDPVDSANIVKSHTFSNIPVSRNGYLYVYCSNESPTNVFFDNLQVIHTRGPLLEETHYYPFGLTMAGISSKALNSNYAENKKKFNGIEQNTAFDLNIYDAFYRNLDPQVGRFWQVDPESDNLECYSPYESMGNNPVTNLDPLGDFRTRFGAWWDRLWNGGGEIKKNENGEWFIEKTRTEAMADGNAAIVSYKYYGKGRNQYTAVGENIRDEQERQADVDHMVKLGVLQRVNTQQEANDGNLKAFVGVLLPNMLKFGTLKVNAPSNPFANRTLQELQTLVKGHSAAFRKLFPVNEKGAQAILENIENIKIPEGLTKELLQAYRELIKRVPDTRGTQAIRAQILDALLKRFK